MSQEEYDAKSFYMTTMYGANKSLTLQVQFMHQMFHDMQQMTARDDLTLRLIAQLKHMSMALYEISEQHINAIMTIGESTLTPEQILQCRATRPVIPTAAEVWAGFERNCKDERHETDPGLN